MATFQEVKAFINDKIKDNENGEITGSVLNEALTLLLGAIPQNSSSSSIPVVSSEEELANLSQNKGELAIVLSEDSEKMGYVPALSLYQATQEEFVMSIEGGVGLSMCDSIAGIQIDSDISITPCPSLSNITIAAYISGDAPLATGVLVIMMTIDANGYPSQLAGTDLLTGAEYGILATYNAATGKLEVDESVSIAINEHISTFDAKWVFIGTQDGAPITLNEETSAAFSFMKCLTKVITSGAKSIRVKENDGYARFDADVIRVLSESAVNGIDSLSMPRGSMVRVYIPESVAYDTDLASLRVPANDDVTSASVVNKVELQLPSDFSESLLPHIRMIDASGTKQCNIIFMTSEAGLRCILGGTGLSDVVLGENGVWNEDNLKRIDELLADGINILDYVALGSVALFDSTTGEPNPDLVMAAAVYLSPFVKLYCNERTLPERVDVYDKLSAGWKKREEGGSGSGGGANVTIDDAMSDTSGNPVKNSVIKAYIDNAVKTKQDTISDLDALRAGASDGTAAKAEVQNLSAEVQNLSAEIVDNEAVIAAALSELDARIKNLESRMDAVNL